MNNGFEAVFDSNSKILILGSFPSVKSRETGFYYGNKQNRFWKMLENVFDEKIEDSIEFKKAFLLKHYIALFDVVKQSDISGSADTNLKKSSHKIADLSFLLPPNTKVEKILCNGKTAFELLTKNSNFDLEIFCLPSTSPANPSFKFEAWENHLKFLK